MIYGKYAAIAGAVAIAVLWPFASGQIGQSFYDREIQNTDSSYLTVTNVSYERGYLSSNVVTQLSVMGSLKDQFEIDNIPTTYLVKSYVTHGFLNIGSDSSFEMTPETKAFFDTIWPTEKSPISLRLETSVIGETRYSLNVLPIDMSEEDVTIKSAKMVLDGIVDRDGFINLVFELPFVDINIEEVGNVIVKNIMGESAGQFIDDIWIGAQSVDLAATHINDKESGSKININNLTVDVINQLSTIDGTDVNIKDPDNLRLNNKNMLSFEKIDVENTIEIENFKMGLDVNSLDFSSIVKLATLIDSVDVEPTDEQTIQIGQAMDTLINKGMSLTIEPLDINTPEGLINANLGLTLESGLTNISQNIMALFTNLHGGFEINIPIPYMQGIPELADMANSLDKYGFTSQVEDSVKISAKIEDGKIVSSNGSIIPINALIMLMM